MFPISRNVWERGNAVFPGVFPHLPPLGGDGNAGTHPPIIEAERTGTHYQGLGL
jgi:hypothetical protein